MRTNQKPDNENIIESNTGWCYNCGTKHINIKNKTNFRGISNILNVSGKYPTTFCILLVISILLFGSIWLVPRSLEDFGGLIVIFLMALSNGIFFWGIIAFIDWWDVK